MASSGDVLADRRYGYAEAALAEEDFAAAADLAQQVLELAPAYGPAWFLLGQALEASGRAAQARTAFRSARDLDRDDILGAGVRLAILGEGDPGRAMSPGYVARLFDDYAIRFDRHLRNSLAYRGPEVLHDGVRRACSLRLRPAGFGATLDLGCGTGLAGEVFRGDCGTLAGIDLSAAMVRRAEAKRIYDELAVGDLVGWMGARPDGSADLILAADVFVYLADLAPAFREAARLLGPDGLFAFTVQDHDGRGVQLGPDGRYGHAEAYLHEIAGAAGLAVVLSESVSTRQDRGRDVPGRLLVLGR